MIKQLLRKSSRENLKTISCREKQEFSSVITEKILSSKAWKDADSVFLFVSMLSREPSTCSLISDSLNSGKITAVPRIDPLSGIMTFKTINDLHFPDEVLVEKHPFGFYQPGAILPDIYPEKSRNNMIIVPGVAFSPDCQRLGNGGGFYDRFLSSLNDNSTTIGICFQIQIVSTMPVEKHDVSVMKVCTESSWYSNPDL
ncbi:MAG: 5-formyltetrahydrofolate cyclo-ligase [Phycisphaerae bacterium]|nr:5-formyltetrahydrofolate cyclo-ligase [Phycisphaerae bacterium]